MDIHVIPLLWSSYFPLILRCKESKPVRELQRFTNNISLSLFGEYNSLHYLIKVKILTYGTLTSKYFYAGLFSDIWLSIVDLIYSGFFSSYETIWSVSLFQTEEM